MPASTNEFAIKLRRAHRALHAWYGLYGRRDLPWRNTRDPYHVYVSEIMLQQTQVKTVLERYYGPFLKRFPTLKSLASAAREQVVKQWEGLGYYTRAANLHKAAKQAAASLPGTPEALMALPGVGRNTAHAVACFGFGLAVPIMEANVRRVLCRVFALKVADEAVLWQKAEQLFDAKNAFDYNQAMMDIGAMVCTKRSPCCGECPLVVVCKGKASPQSYPASKAKKAPPVRRRRIVVFAEEQGRYYLSRRDTRFLNGLYGFMEYDADATNVEWKGRRYALRPELLLGAVTQVYSHFTLQAKVYLVPVASLKKMGKTLAEIAHLPLSRADHKITQLLKEKEGKTGMRSRVKCPGQHIS